MGIVFLIDLVLQPQTQDLDAELNMKLFMKLSKMKERSKNAELITKIDVEPDKDVANIQILNAQPNIVNNVEIGQKRSVLTHGETNAAKKPKKNEKRCEKHWEETTPGKKVWVENPATCKWYDASQCAPVTKYRTEQEKYTQCSKVPYQHCDRVKDTNCRDVPQQKCDDVP